MNPEFHTFLEFFVKLNRSLYIQLHTYMQDRKVDNSLP